MDTHTSDERPKTLQLQRPPSVTGTARLLTIHTTTTDPFLSSTAASPRRHGMSPGQPEFIDTDFSSPLFSDENDNCLGLNLTKDSQKTTSTMMNRVVSSAAPYQQASVVSGSGFVSAPLMQASGVQFAARSTSAMPMLMPQQSVNYGKALTHTVVSPGGVVQQQPQPGTMFICMPAQQQQQLLQQQQLVQQQQQRLPQQLQQQLQQLQQQPRQRLPQQKQLLLQQQQRQQQRLPQQQLMPQQQQRMLLQQQQQQRLPQQQQQQHQLLVQQQILQQQQQQCAQPQVLLPQHQLLLQQQQQQRPQTIQSPVASQSPRMIGQPGVLYQPIVLDGQFSGQQFLANTANTVFMPVQRMPAATIQQQPPQQQQVVTMATVRSASVPQVSYVRHIQPKSAETIAAASNSATVATVSPPKARRRRKQWQHMFVNNNMPVRFTPPSPSAPTANTSILSIPRVPGTSYLPRQGYPRAIAPHPVSPSHVLPPSTAATRYHLQPNPSHPQLHPLNMVVQPPRAMVLVPRNSIAINGTQSVLKYRDTDVMLQPTDLSVKSTVCSLVKQSAKQQPNAVKESKCDAAVPNSGQIEVGQTSDLKEASESLVDSTTLGEAEGPVEYDDFLWEDYLQDTSSIAAPPTSFRHVECSLESGFEKSMKLEVANKQYPGTYWVASIVMTCGQLLRLRHEGVTLDDSSGDFWCDVISSDIHPIGWCRQNDKKLEPPEELKGLREDWDGFLEATLRSGITAPAYLLDGRTGTTPVDQIKAGMRLETQHDLEPSLLWIVKILENVGGRLLLRYEGIVGEAADFWLFYLDHRLHPIGWAQQHGCIYKPPTVVLEGHDSGTAWTDLLSKALKEAQLMSLPPDIFKDQAPVPVHGFTAGVKLEALHPHDRSVICPATVAQIIDDHYVLIKIDSLAVDGKSSVQFCCHAASWSILPVGWCARNDVSLAPPTGWTKEEFSWTEYLAQTGSIAALDDAFRKASVEHDFEANMKVEAENPSDPAQVCPATITRIVDELLWLHLDSEPDTVASFVTSTESHDIFPVGWCESNGYDLKPPLTWKRRRIVTPQPKAAPTLDNNKSSKPSTDLKSGDKGGSTACPKIYFNHRCFSGPYLSKGRIATLPKSIGPGNVCLVMKEVLGLIINVAYKSSRVLRELQMEGPGSADMEKQVLKAKYKGKSYRAMVQICKTSDQIDQFCRRVCLRLECCPNLVSSQNVNGRCPERCFALTKTKYTHYYGKKKKRAIGRPPGGHSNLENGQRKPGKRRKRRKLILTHRKKSMATATNGGLNAFEDDFGESSDGESMMRDYDDDSDASFDTRKKRCYKHRVLPPTEICTRGGDRPRFGFERLTHQKILLGSPRKKHKRMDVTEMAAPVMALPPRKDTLQLESNPLSWTVKKVVEFMKTTDCAGLTKIFKDQEIDGQALLLLTLPAVQEHLELKLGPAVKLCHHVERIKVAFFEQFAR